MRTLTRGIAAALTVLAGAAVAHAQSATAPAEDIEPRVIGTAGTTLVGLSGYVDAFFSSERDLPFNYSAQVDAGRFLTNAFVVRGGLRGSGSVGGDDAENLIAGSGAPALHAFGGLLYYLTPRSLVSLYAGAEYWAQLTQRRSPDAGSIVGTFGVQGALSSRASLFIEGGYGMGLRKNDDEVRVSRIVGQVGVRLKF
jgi:hypothetical protein